MRERVKKKVTYHCDSDTKMVPKAAKNFKCISIYIIAIMHIFNTFEK